MNNRFKIMYEDLLFYNFTRKHNQNVYMALSAWSDNSLPKAVNY